MFRTTISRPARQFAQISRTASSQLRAFSMSSAAQANEFGQGKSHATGGPDNSAVPKPVQEAVPKAVEEALPDAVSTADKRHDGTTG